MKKIAIGLIAAAGVALATPALAEGFYFGAGPGGVGIGVGGPGYYDGGYYHGYGPRYGYRDYDGTYAYDPGYRRCRVRIIETPYGTRRVRRCF